MFITTTHWDTKPTDQSMLKDLEAKSLEIANGFESTRMLDFLGNNRLTVSRTWPTQEAADAWCTYVLSKGATSCESEPYAP